MSFRQRILPSGLKCRYGRLCATLKRCKAAGKVVGTVEVFDNLDRAKRGAALHIDLSVPYETRTYIAELLNLADEKLFHRMGASRGDGMDLGIENLRL